MIADDFKNLVLGNFYPFMKMYGFGEFEFSLSGRNYSARTRSTYLEISLNYEPGEKYLSTYIFKIMSGIRSDIDDAENTLTLKGLRNRFGTAITRPNRNESGAFSEVKTQSKEEREIRRVARDLKLLLRLYLDEIERDGDTLNDNSRA